MRKIILCFTALLLVTDVTIAEDFTCLLYFTGIGCPHCAKTDPVVLGELPLRSNSSLVVIEYEIYQNPINARVMESYHSSYDIPRGIPQFLVEEGLYIVGDRMILDNLEDIIADGNACLLVNGTMSFSEMDLNELPGRPSIWMGDKILIRTENGNTSDELLKEILFSDNVSDVVNGTAEVIEPQTVPLSGSNVKFGNAARIDGWIVQWGAGSTSGDRVGDRWIYYYIEGGVWALLGFAIIVLIVVIIKALIIIKRGDKHD